MKSNITVQNLKCDGCANSIRKELEKLYGVTTVEVDVSAAEVSLEHINSIKTIENSLLQLGYPATDTTNSFKTKAKSFISCGIGRLSNWG